MNARRGAVRSGAARRAEQRDRRRYLLSPARRARVTPSHTTVLTLYGSFTFPPHHASPRHVHRVHVQAVPRARFVLVSSRHGTARRGAAAARLPREAPPITSTLSSSGAGRLSRTCAHEHTRESELPHTGIRTVQLYGKAGEQRNFRWNAEFVRETRPGASSLFDACVRVDEEISIRVVRKFPRRNSEIERTYRKEFVESMEFFVYIYIEID